MVKPVNPRGVQDANLIPGGVGSKVWVESQGLVREAFALAVKIRDFGDSLDATHKGKLSWLSRLAKANFDAKTPKRPGEHLHQGKRRPENFRQTGKFTFGARSGGAFIGVYIKDDENMVSGFGYPNVPVADERTNYVWRTLEFGLRPHPEAVTGERIQRNRTPIGVEHPIGVHKLPKRFSFTSSNPSVARLVPMHAEAATTAQFIRLFGKKRGVGKQKRVTAKGIEPLFFLTDAIVTVADSMPSAYKQVVAKTFGRR